MDFEARIKNGLITWSSKYGLLGAPLQVLELLNYLDGTEKNVFGPGPSIVLEEKNKYAVLYAIGQLFPDAELSGEVPNFEDLTGPATPGSFN